MIRVLEVLCTSKYNYTGGRRLNCLRSREITAAEVLVVIERTVPQWKAETMPRAATEPDF